MFIEVEDIETFAMLNFLLDVHNGVYNKQDWNKMKEKYIEESKEGYGQWLLTKEYLQNLIDRKLS
jgi:hypothetical protein